MKFCLLFFTTLLTSVFVFGQERQTDIVVCDLTYETTLQTFKVYIHNPSGTTLYKAKMYIDADGSPRAYGPNNSGLDYTANAGSPGNWWGIVTDGNGDPVIQGASDPYPGMYVSTTSLVNSSYGTTNPLRYTNSETVPFFVLPSSVVSGGGIKIGDVGYVYNTVTQQGCFAIYADAGPSTSLGEGSIYLASQIGVGSNPKTGGTSLGIIDYIVFPQSGYGQGKIPTIAQIDSIGNAWLNSPSVGGPGITDCLESTSSTDNVAPTTSISGASAWDTTTFTATFTDNDNSGGSGIEKSFYQIADNNGTEWRANNQLGFFYDDFNLSSIHTEWTQKAGAWSINGANFLEQSNEGVANTNIYAPLVQNLSNRYFYHFKGKLNGSGTNRRAGFHFFADAPDSSNRGNSYFVWFRLDDDKIQVYEVVDNSWGTSPVKDTAYNFTAGTTYDFKIFYDRITGLIRVYVNNVKSCEWTDATPLANGSYVSFRSANCNFQIDDFEVYRTRQSTTAVTLGTANSNKIRYQNFAPNLPAGKIRSMVTDNAGNISTITSVDVNVDWTAPVAPASIKDGLTQDADTTETNDQLDASWATGVDVNSGINSYLYSFGTSPGGTEIIDWTVSTSMDTFVTKSGLNLVNGQMYYCNVRSKNNAGMYSAAYSSDGIVYLDLTSVKNIEEETFVISPNPAQGSVKLWLKNANAGSVQILNSSGQKVMDTFYQEGKMIDLSELQNGLYTIQLSNSGKTISGKLVICK